MNNSARKEGAAMASKSNDSTTRQPGKPARGNATKYGK
jgi:hypothetical protein